MASIAQITKKVGDTTVDIYPLTSFEAVRDGQGRTVADVIAGLGKTPIVQGLPSGGCVPGVLYSLGSISTDQTVNLNIPTDTSITNEYMFQFRATADLALLFNRSVKFIETPEFKADNIYEVSIAYIDGLWLGIFAAWEDGE